jgi:hypothetical protein
MGETTSFGRRQSRAGAPPAAPSPLSRDAEAFRMTLRAGRAAETTGFAAWWRAQLGRRLAIALARLALLAPSLICFVAQTSLALSIGLAIAGVLGGRWLRQERRRHLKAIASWDAPPSSGPG